MNIRQYFRAKLAMNKSQTDLPMTTNQDYGSFYFGRVQHGQINSADIAFELSMNDQVRNERRQFPSIAYDIMFDKHDSIEIVTHDKRKYKPVISRRQLKYIKSKKKTMEERRIMIKNALESYTTFIKCIYHNKPEKNPELSDIVLRFVANELVALNPEISAEELVENMVAITVPHQYMDMPAINPNKPYPGTESECTKTPGIQSLLDQFQTVRNIIADSKQRFDSKSISSQPMEGVRYIYNPFINGMPSRRI